MQQLPLKLNADLMQARWKSIIDPLLSNPVNNVSLLQDVALTNGLNIVNHKLNRVPEGWFITDIDMPANIWRYGEATDTTISLIVNGISLSFTGNITNGSAVITNVTNIYAVQPGMTVVAIGIPVTARVLEIVSSTSFSLTQNATVTTVGATITTRPVTTTVNLGVF